MINNNNKRSYEKAKQSNLIIRELLHNLNFSQLKQLNHDILDVLLDKALEQNRNQLIKY